MSTKKNPFEVLEASFAKNPADHCIHGECTESFKQDSFLVNWSANKFGFGQLYFYIDDNFRMHCANEYMSKDSIKKILSKMVDDCILDDVHDENNCFCTGKDKSVSVYPKATVGATDGHGYVFFSVEPSELGWFYKRFQDDDFRKSSIEVFYKHINGNHEKIMDVQNLKFEPDNHRFPNELFSANGSTIRNNAYAELINTKKAGKFLVATVHKTENSFYILIENEQADFGF